MSKGSIKPIAVVAAAAVLAVFITRRACGDSDGAKVRPRSENATAVDRPWSHPDPAALPVASLSGTVTGDHGAPVAGANVCAWASSPDLSTADTREPTCARTAQNGTYRLAKVVPARYRVTANARGYLPAAYKAAADRDTVTAKAGEDLTGIDMVLARGGVEITGVVKDIGGGPVASALVTASPAGFTDGAAAYARTGEDGRFSTWVAPGNVLVSAVAAGYAPGHIRGLAPGQVLTLYLTPESVLAGRVVDADTGAAIARALVHAGNLSPSRGFLRGAGGIAGSTAYTDESGRFRLAGLLPGRYKPTAEAVGRTGQTQNSVLLGLGQTVTDVVIEVHPAFVVSGQVTIAGDDPEPCAGAPVTLTDHHRDRTASAITDDAGKVELRAVLPGHYEVTIRCASHLSHDSYPEIAIEDHDVTGQIWEVTGGATIRGRVHNPDGEPVAGARIWTRTTTGDPRAQRTGGTAVSDDDGSFEIKGLAAGSYTLRARSDAYPPTSDGPTVTVGPDGVAEADIELAAGGAITGVVVDERGEAMAAVTVRAQGKSFRIRGNTTTQTRDDGTFSMTGVAPGPYRVLAVRGWFSQMRKPGTTDDDLQGEQVTVKAGATAEVKLVVEDQSGEIHGQVLDEGGEPVNDAFIERQRETDSAQGSGWANLALRWQVSGQPVLTDLEGKFSLTELSAGKYTVRAYRRGGGEAIAHHVATGSEVTLTIPAASSLAGKVVVPGEAPLSQFDIQVVDKSSGYRRSEQFFRTDGSFAMTELPAATYEVSVRAPEGTATETVTVAAGEDRTGIVLTLKNRVTITGRLVDMANGKPVPGMRVTVRPATTLMGGLGLGGKADKKEITDDRGRFEIEDAPAGRLLVLAIPTSWLTSEYSFSQVLKTVPGGEPFDIGDVQVPRRRIGARERAGDLGYDLVRPSPSTDPEDLALEVALIRPDGPAADSGLKVGDQIIAVDGHSVAGADAALYYTLARVPAGTTIKLGLARGQTVAITAAAPR
ncbi:MAG TPA: carboxypeptidase regulatory-like domain-containing protein [Kofleriaceae bacterium]|nr:carboxypeptidase regulatory-like domain-containing protein [Kofleriaceae bacterium]